MPCFQSKITEASFFRIRESHPQYANEDEPLIVIIIGPAAGVPLDATKRKQLFEELSDIPKASESTRELLLTQDLGSYSSVLVSEFRPVEGDKTSYTWKTNSGSSITIEMPLYCLTSIEGTKAVMWKYLEDNGDKILEAILEYEKDIIWDTIRMATRFSFFQKVFSRILCSQPTLLISSAGIDR